MIARPKMSQNEWKPTEIRASKVGQRLTLFLPRYLEARCGPGCAYVILDDRDDAARGDAQRARFVRTDPASGLTDEDVRRAAAILGS